MIHQPDGGLAGLGRWLDFFLRITVNRPDASNLRAGPGTKTGGPCSSVGEVSLRDPGTRGWSHWLYGEFSKR